MACCFCSRLSRAVPLLRPRRSGAKTKLSIAGSRFFLGKSEGQTYEAAGVRTDALIFAKTPDGFLAARTTHVEENGRLQLKSDRRASFIIAQEKTGVKVDYANVLEPSDFWIHPGLMV